MKQTSRLWPLVMLGLLCSLFVIGCTSKTPDAIVESVGTDRLYTLAWIIQIGSVSYLIQQTGYYEPMDLERIAGTDTYSGQIIYDDCGVMDQHEAYSRGNPWATLYSGTCEGMLFGAIELQNSPGSDPQVFYSDDSSLFIDVNFQGVYLSATYSNGSWNSSSLPIK